VEEAEPLQLKGKAEPVTAYRLLSVRGAEGFPRRLDAPMVGRTGERRRCSPMFGGEWSPSAPAICSRSSERRGVGKSRLAAEFLASLGGAVVVRGRCLPYGAGITYWPLVEVLKQLPEAELDEAAAVALQGLLGDGSTVTSSDEIAWAFRKRLEAVAADRPLACVFDDVHWGEETFLDLVEHVADLSRDAPILLLCLARRDLLAAGRVGQAGRSMPPMSCSSRSA
jgi:hypothetical protein